MTKRIITGVIVGAIAIVIIVFRNFAGGVLLYGGLYILYLIALHEMLRALRNRGQKPARWPIFVTGALLMPAYLWRGADGMLLVYCLGTVLAMCSSIFIRDPREGDIVATAFPLVYPTLPFLAFFMIAALDEPYKLSLFLAVCISSVASDIFALVFGLCFGKHKLIPSVSPKKTWEGAIGGFVMSVLVMTAFGLILNANRDDALWIWHFVALGAIGSVATQLGDLVASAVKRYCGIKDFGRIFPGHGGVLDRLDGMLFNAVFLYMYALLVIGGLR